MREIPPRRRTALAALLAALVAVLLVGATAAVAQPTPRDGDGQTQTSATPATTAVPGGTATGTGTGKPTPEQQQATQDAAKAANTLMWNALISGADTPQSVGLIEGLSKESKLCLGEAGQLSAEGAKSCKMTGSLASNYPSDNYGLDNNVDASVTSPTTWITSMLQWLIGVIWLGLVYAVKFVLMALEWAFTTDIYGKAQGDTNAGVLKMYDIVGAPWLSLAFGSAGLWGLWNGLVRRRSVETIGALAATLCMMVGAQLIIHDPQDTIGPVSKLTDQAALAAVGAASSGTVNQPAAAFGDAEHNLFDAIVLGPWCGLEFGDVGYCTTEHDGVSVADVWLSFTPGSQARQLLFKRTQGTDHGGSFTDDLKESGSAGWAFVKGIVTGGPVKGVKKASSNVSNWVFAQQAVSKQAGKIIKKDPNEVVLQQSSGTMKRFALLMIIGVGMIGAIALIGSLAIRLLVQGGLMTLLLLLLMPLALLAPAFGDGGRKVFVGYVKMLMASIVSKFIYAALLAAVILVAGIIAGLQDDLGWLPSWALLSMFWWSLFLRRRELLAMIQLDSGRSHGNVMQQAFYAARMARGVGHGLTSTAKNLTVRPVRAVARPLRRNLHSTRQGEEQAVRQNSQHWARKRALEAAGAEYVVAAKAVQQLGHLRNKHKENHGKIAKIDKDLAKGGVTGPKKGALLAQRKALAAHNAKLEQHIAHPRFQQAQSALRRGKNPELGENDVERWASQRRFDVDNREWHDPVNLRAAGISPSAHGRAVQAGDAVKIAEHERRSTEQMRMDRVMLKRSNPRDQAPMGRRERRAGRKMAEVHHGEGKVQRAVDLGATAYRQAQRAKRVRDKLYR